MHKHRNENVARGLMLVRSARGKLVILLLGVAFVLSRAFAEAQTTPAQPQQATLQGVVIKDSGAEPLKKALIELIAESPRDAGNHTALTGPDGGFRIENIAPGRYRLFVEKVGYQEVDKRRRRVDGRMLTLSAGQELKDLTIRLQAAAVVEGRVTDEDGDPMAEAQVAIFRQTFVAGRNHWEQVAAERTNDLGEYRIAALSTGNYFVSVTPPPDFKSLIESAGNITSAAASAATPQPPAPASYQTTYYPGTRDRGQAAPIQLHAGDDFPANFSLTPAPSFSISGWVVNLPPGFTATITLQSKDSSLIQNGAEIRKDGSFEIRDVAPGSYTILASVDGAAAPMMARQALQITSENVEGLRLAPQTGGSIRGRIRMESGGKARPDPSQMFLLLRSADSEDDTSVAVAAEQNFSTLAHVNPDGSFEWDNVPAGRYWVQISDASAMPDWFFKSASAGGRDVLDAGVNVSGGATALDLVASANGAVIDGFAKNEKDEVVADAQVVAVPDPRHRGYPDRYRQAATDQSGHFTLRGLPPGDYTVFAWDGIEDEAYYNPDFIKQYEGQGKALHVNEGEHVSMSTKVVSVAEDQP